MNPLDGNLFVFRGRSGSLIKVIWSDGQGSCLFTKKLDRGRFVWPSAQGGSIAISPAQLSYLLCGFREFTGRCSDQKPDAIPT